MAIVRELAARAENGRQDGCMYLACNIMSANGFGKSEMWVPPMKRN